MDGNDYYYKYLEGAHKLMKIIEGKKIQLRPVILPDDCREAVKWYSDPEVLFYSEGKDTEPYDLKTVERMYKYLDQIGELYIIEIKNSDGYRPIGDITLSEDTLPLVIGVKEFRSMGIGKEAIEMIIERARQLGWKKLRVKKVYDYNEKSKRLFLRQGFKLIGTGREENGQSYSSYELLL